jgi:hypothetical protein
MFYDNLNERSQETIQKAEFYLRAGTSRKAILLMAHGVLKGTDTLSAPPFNLLFGATPGCPNSRFNS